MLFGSRARGDYKYSSDIDIAIITEGEIEPGFMLDLDEAAGIYKIDMVDFNKLTSQALKEIILQEGVVIYERRD